MARRRLKVHEARYGANRDGIISAVDQWEDVTRIVRGFVEDGRLVFGVGNGPLGG